MTDNYHYGIIGNCFSGALVSRDGSIDWCCLPRFDSPFVFAKLLDEKSGGSFGIDVDRRYTIEQSYIKHTNVLRTVFTSRKAAFEVLDFMPRYHRMDALDRYYCPPDIIRVFRPLYGTPKLRLKYDPRLYYAEHKTITEPADGYIKSYTEDGAYESCYLYSSFPHMAIIDGEELTLDEDHFVLVSYHQKILPPSIQDAILHLEKTKVYWLDWVARTKTPTLYIEQVIRSALALKLLTFQPTGAVLAALTTSLPETIGEERNWDYRFCWIRDASMTISVFTELGHESSVLRFVHYILSLISYKDQKMQIMYDVRGNAELTERTLEQFAGYLDSKPVRIGNAAYEQKQNDMYGILLDVISRSILAFERHEDTLDRVWTIVRMLVRNVEHHWRGPDRGIWEIRGSEEHFVFSKVLCWVALDRGVKIATYLNQTEYIDEWTALRDEIHADVMLNGWNEEVGAFTQAYGNKHLDAANLLLESYGFIEASDKKYISTVHKTREALCNGSLMYRYKNEDDFGLPKSAFTVCSFWMIEALYRIGEPADATAMFNQLLGYSNHLGLFSEDLDFETKRLLGNFPQAYSHLALISAAVTISSHRSIDMCKVLENELLR